PWRPHSTSPTNRSTPPARPRQSVRIGGSRQLLTTAATSPSAKTARVSGSIPVYSRDCAALASIFLRQIEPARSARTVTALLSEASMHYQSSSLASIEQPCLTAPLIKELAGPTRRLIVPELLEVLLEQIGPHGLQVVAQQIAQAEPLMLGQVGLALEHAPTGLLQHRLVAVAGQPTSLGGTHLVQRGIHLGDNMEAIEDVDGLAAPLADHLQIRLPHVRADKLDLSGQLFADQGEELLEALHCPLATDP